MEMESDMFVVCRMRMMIISPKNEPKELQNAAEVVAVGDGSTVISNCTM